MAIAPQQELKLAITTPEGERLIGNLVLKPRSDSSKVENKKDMNAE
jgi:hypothetical protein